VVSLIPVVLLHFEAMTLLNAPVQAIHPTGQSSSSFGEGQGSNCGESGCFLALSKVW